MKKIALLALCAMLFSSMPALAVQTGTAWPQMLADPSHSSHSTDNALTVKTAATFGVKWMTNIYNTDLGSPVVAYNATLGKTVVYVGTQRADIFAVDASNGQVLWSTNLGINDKIEDTPAVDAEGNVWAGTAYNAKMYKIDGASGAVLCSAAAPVPVNGSPMITTPAGGVETVYWDAIDTNAYQGFLYATRTADCSQEWSFSDYVKHAGSWTTPAFGVTPSGESLVFVGSSDPDSTEYAVDALTGNRAWFYTVRNPSGTDDIGAASTISPPGRNGFADGVTYVPTKAGDFYALDMTTGANLWTFQIAPGTNAASSRSSAALDGVRTVFGYGHDTGFGGSGGVYSINASTSSVYWQYSDPGEVLSSPIIVGPVGAEIVAFGDLLGQFHVLKLSDGGSLYTYQTSSYITSSAAEANGTIFIAGADGFLYAFAPAGGAGAAPTAVTTSPANNSVLANPNGTITVTGTASDASSVTGVQVAIQQSGASGPWYSGTTGAFSNAAPIPNAATLDTPGAASANWSYTFPVPASGSTFEIFVNAVNAQNIAGKPSSIQFSVQPSISEPNLQVSNSYPAPGQTISAQSTAFRPGEQVTFTLLGKVAATATAGPKGHVPSTTIYIPTSAPFGPTSLTMTGQTSGKTTSAVIYISNNWNQGGHDATRTGYEPHDGVIAASLSIANNTVLNQSWYYSSGSPINSSPAIYQRVAYFGNDAGTLTAVVVNTGAPAWTYTTPTHKPIATAPALDGSGNVIFTSTDSSLYIVTNTGQLLVSTPLAGKLTSPAVNSGNVFVTSDTGTLYKLSEPSGALVWNIALPGASHAPPSYDAANNLVIATDDLGNVTAYAADTGAQVWQYKTGGAVVASAMIFSGSVYVGSTDGNVYALAESNGALNWKSAMTGPITVAPAVYDNVEFSVVDANGIVNLYNVDGQRDAQRISQHKGPVGMSNVLGNILVTYSNGFVGMVRFGGPGPFAWNFRTASTLSTQTAIVDGTVYIGAGDGALYAFTPQGATPTDHSRATVTAGDGSTWSCTTP